MSHVRTNPRKPDTHIPPMISRSAILMPLLLVAAATAIHAQDTLRAPALLVSQGGATFQRVWLTSSTKSTVTYYDTEVSTASKEARISEYETIHIFEPADYATAIDLFQARSYEEAEKLFAKVKEQYRPVATIEDNPSTLAAFYHMECLRKLGDLKGLSDMLAGFDKSPLTREHQLRQIELYSVWEAVRNEDWQQVASLCGDRAKSRLPGDQRAQISYCHGLSMEALNREDEAIAAYHIAMTSDAAASEDISRKAALRVLSILSSRPQVRHAIQVWETPEEKTSSPGYSDLLQASALARLYLMSLGGGEPLPEKLKNLPEFRPKNDQSAGAGAPPPATE